MYVIGDYKKHIGEKMVEVIIDGCRCVCTNAKFIEHVDMNAGPTPTPLLEILLVVTIVILAILGLIKGFNKLKECDDENE